VATKLQEDVFLSDGRGFMVGAEKYKEHIATSVEYKQVFFLPFPAKFTSSETFRKSNVTNTVQ
jgi:hypothetical protein